MGMYDGYPILRKHKVKITAISCICCYLLGLPCASNAGQYVLDIMDTYASGTGVLFIAFWEIVGFMWIFGYHGYIRLWYWCTLHCLLGNRRFHVDLRIQK